MYPDFTADELLTMGDKLNHDFDLSFARHRLIELGVPFDRRVDRLAGGQRAQVALCLALAKRPQLLLLDEPLASLDPLARREFLAALRVAVAEEPMTIILSSHLITDLEQRRRPKIAGVQRVVSVSNADRQATLLVRTNGDTLDPAWDKHDVSLEGMVLGSLASPSPHGLAELEKADA